MTRRRSTKRTPTAKRIRDPRLEVSETASNIGSGPITFDLEHARAWGWSEQQISKLWARLFPMIQREGSAAQRARPELYAINPENGVVIFVGAIDNHPAWNDATVGRAGLIRLGKP